MSRPNKPNNFDTVLLFKDNIPVLIPDIEYLVYKNEDTTFFMTLGNGIPFETIYFQSTKGTTVLTNLRLIFISDLIYKDDKEEEKSRDKKLFETFYTRLDKIHGLEKIRNSDEIHSLKRSEKLDVQNLLIKLNDNKIGNVSIQILKNPTSIFKDILLEKLRNLDPFFYENYVSESTSTDLAEIYEEFLHK